MICAAILPGCALLPGTFSARNENAELLQGPPIEDVVTAFDEALTCLRGKVQPGVIFAVGQIVDATGKESYAEGGTGKFVTQGAGEMVQSALFRAGVTVVNRRDPNIFIVETQWGIRDLSQQIPVNFYISGSINSLDFIPGGGFSAQVGGVGPRYLQNRILIGLDLTMTDAFTGRIVASVPLQKQIFSSEVGASMGRFFSETLVSLDMGGQEREAVNFALRQMLSLATLELLGQVMNRATFAPCKDMVSPFAGSIGSTGTGDPDVLQVAAERAPLMAPQQQAAQPAAQQQTQAVRSIDDQVRELANHAMVFGARAVAAAEESLAAETLEVAAQKAAEATELLRGAAQILQRAAELGLAGPTGDAAALVVERGMGIVTQAQDALAVRVQAERRPDVPQVMGAGALVPGEAAAASDATLAPPPVAAPVTTLAPAPPAVPQPGTPEAQRRGLAE
jgi:curli biogenesis system outer membrane secretion channel CsgG